MSHSQGGSCCTNICCTVDMAYAVSSDQPWLNRLHYKHTDLPHSTEYRAENTAQLKLELLLQSTQHTINTIIDYLALNSTRLHECCMPGCP